MVSYNIWVYNNNEHIKICYNIILNNLENNNIKINDKKKLYKDVVNYLYNNFN